MLIWKLVNQLPYFLYLMEQIADFMKQLYEHNLPFKFEKNATSIDKMRRKV